MANTSDFIANVYDFLAHTFNFSNAPSQLMLQMAWPGISIPLADLKDAQGRYVPQKAEELISSIANIAPISGKSRYENSGFNIDDLYEIIIASARPSGVNQAELAVNPRYKLFADAQYNFLQGQRVSIDDPLLTYYTCKATPSNWYDESASAFWAQLQIKSQDMKPAAQSIFIKNNGQQLINQGVWKIAPKGLTQSILQNQLLTKVQNNKLQLINTHKLVDIKVAPNILTVNAQKMLKGSILQPNAVTTAILSNNLKTQFTAFNAKNNNIKLAPTNNYDSSADLIKALKPGVINPEKLMVQSKTLPLPQSVFINQLLLKDLASLPASPNTNGFNISFKFCRVNIDRPWLNLALLASTGWYMPGSSSGEYSNGLAENNTGLFPLLPTSFILISDLKISANWSVEDRNTLAQAVSFGPFDIRQGSFNQNTLEVKGMQIIACISRVNPVLAPDNAPAIV